LEKGSSPRTSTETTVCKPCKLHCQASTNMHERILHRNLQFHAKHTMPPPRITSAFLRAQPQLRLQCFRRIAAVRHASTTPSNSDIVKPVVPWKTPTSVWSPENLIPPPKDGEILMERRPNRELPPYVPQSPAMHEHPPTNLCAPSVPPLISKQVVRTFPLFLLAMFITTAAFFNYQKQESSVVTSTLYALRTNPAVREQLGDEIYFASKYPWIKGEINQVHGRIDITFWVKGTRKQGEVRLRCRRRGRGGLYYTQEWSLTIENGERMELYDPNGNAIDPFQDPIGEE
jgi:cytochrome c oxidase assembly factor 1